MSTEYTFIDPVTFAPFVGVHDKTACAGGPCPLHKSSFHRLISCPMFFSQRESRLFRRCPCGEFYHPDPDDLEYRATKTRDGRTREELADHECCPGECCSWVFAEASWVNLGKFISHEDALETAEIFALDDDNNFLFNRYTGEAWTTRS